MSKIMIGKYDATIYPEGNGYTGAIDLGVDARGKRRRVKRKGRTKAQVKDKLREAVADLEAGVTTDAGYTVQDAVTDFLQKGLKGTGQRNHRQLPLARRSQRDPADRRHQGQGTDRRPA